MSGRPFAQIVPDAQAIDRRLVSNLHGAVQATITVTTMTARNEHDWKDRTRATRESLEPTVDDLPNGATASLKAEGNAARLSGGTEPHEIRAHGRALRFEMNGETMFRKRVQHPGTKPDPYLDKAADKTEETLDREVDAAVMDALNSIL